jgi:hypothetical protein
MKKQMKDPNKYPPGWNARRVRALAEHYENQSHKEAIAEDEAAFNEKSDAVIVVPKKLIPAVMKLVARYKARAG